MNATSLITSIQRMLVVELDAVEDRRAAPSTTRDVAEVQVAVAFAHEAAAAALGEAPRARGVLALGPGAQRVELRALRAGRRAAAGSARSSAARCARIALRRAEARRRRRDVDARRGTPRPARPARRCRPRVELAAREQPARAARPAETRASSPRIRAPARRRRSPGASTLPVIATTSR